MTNKYQGEDPPHSTFFFPLRTNVEYFASPQGYLTLLERIKQASILYDTLIFEDGMYVATVGEMGSFDLRIPPQDVTEEKLNVEFEPTGGEHFVSWKGQVVLSGPVERRFRSEFYSVLRDLEAERLPWMKMATFALSPDGKRLADRLREEDERNPSIVLPEAGHFLRAKILANLNSDLVLIASLRTAASIDPLYAPILQQKTTSDQRMQPAPGFLALQVAMPNFASVPWETIVQLREKPALVEFRKKMTSIETMARSALPEGEVGELKYQILQTISEELLQEIAHLLPKPSKVVGDVMLDLVLDLMAGLLSVSSQFPVPVGAAVAGFQGIAEMVKANRSWITAFLRLRDPGSGEKNAVGNTGDH
jgi:hypothetical protein